VRRYPLLPVLVVLLAILMLTYDRFGEQYRWQLGQLLNWAGGPSQEEPERQRFNLFPLYIRQHSSKPEEFDAVQQILKGAHTKQIFYVPGEHDTSIDDGKLYLERFGKGTKGTGWYSFNHKGVHLVGLNNVTQTEGMGKIGDEQLEWLERDLKGISTSTPVVLFAHIPLWSIYPDWGWSTSDSERAMSYLKRFGSVTILNGHIHQIMQKVEGNATFHTAMSTAFPQPAPGSAPAPGPMKVPAERLRSVLGLTDVHYVAQDHSLAVVDSPLASVPDGGAPTTSRILTPDIRSSGYSVG